MVYVCPNCNGYGSSLKESSEECSSCHGTGVVKESRSWCKCDGTDPHCPSCEGLGEVSHEPAEGGEMFYKELPQQVYQGGIADMEPAFGEPSDDDDIGPEDVEWHKLPGQDYNLPK